jgi:hypothetical protein
MLLPFSQSRLDSPRKKFDGEIQMKIAAEFIKELSAVSKRLKQRPILLSLWRAIFLFLAIGIYLGAMCATMMFEILPFKVLAWCKIIPSTTLYWILAITFFTVICAVCGFLAIMFFRWLRVGRISVDLFALFLASIVVIWLESLMLFRGW